MISRTRTFTVVAISLAAVLAGCSEGTTDTEPTLAAEPTTTTSEPTTVEPADDSETETSAELSPEQQDQANIEQTLQLYTRTLDEAFNGDESIEGIYPYSRDTAREQWVTQVMADEAQGITSSGLTELELLDIDVNENTAEVRACADVSAVEVFDENGDSYLAEDRLDRTLKDFVLERDDSAELGWYVVDDTNRNEPCDD